ncbi:SUMF1/EgtB/PvdO family nonheme iron enzyme [candidate division KSB1 bacterium]|nr:SUMF1/EgtB/PvdO family nonheme iron enzyme [candidate division KSB1 bacterium]
MKNTVIVFITAFVSLIFAFNCSVDVNKTGARLEVSPTQIRLTETDSMAVITVKNMGNEDLQWQIASAPEWLMLTKRSGELTAGVSDTLSIKYQRSLLDSVLEYREDIAFTSNANPATINVIFQSETPNLGVSKSELNFGFLQSSEKIAVKNTRNGYLDWKATPSVEWISITPDTGHTSPDAPDSVTVTIHKDLLPESGEYQGSIQITSDANGPAFFTTISKKINVMYYNLGISPANLRNGSKIIFPLLTYNHALLPVAGDIYIQPVGQKNPCHWEIVSGNVPSSVTFTEASFQGANCAKFSSAADQEFAADLTIRVTDALNSTVEQSIALTTKSVEIKNPEMVAISGATFTMGDNWNDGLIAERPAHQVNLSAYEISKFEVTNEEFYAFVLAGGYQTQAYWLLSDVDADENAGWQEASSKKWQQPRYWSNSDTPWDTCRASNFADSPVIGISWYEAYAYCKWLNDITGKQYRLPTEAQWERAARGAEDGAKYPWGNSWIETAANWDDNAASDGYLYAAPVGSFESGKSAAGCYDLAGNVWEWCQDWYASYEEGTFADPTGPAAGDARVVRGGSWKSISRSLRTVSRSKIEPDLSNNNIGFRLSSW